VAELGQTGYRFFTELGGLLSYGTDLPDNFGARRRMLLASWRARSRASFQFKPRSSSSWWSISRPRRRSASRSPTGCSHLPMRWSN